VTRILVHIGNPSFFKEIITWNHVLESTEDDSALQQVIDGAHHIMSGIRMQQNQLKEFGAILCITVCPRGPVMSGNGPIFVCHDKHYLELSLFSYNILVCGKVGSCHLLNCNFSSILYVCYIQGNDSGQKCVTFIYMSLKMNTDCLQVILHLDLRQGVWEFHAAIFLIPSLSPRM
jgi:hypothetical protein